MALEKSIRRGVIWTFAGNAGSQVINFAVGIVLARILTPADFGVIATISIFTGLAGFIAGGGISDALVRAESITKADYDVAFTLQLIVGILIFSFFFAAAPAIAAFYDAPSYASVLQVSAISFLLRPFIMTPTSLLYREMRFAPLTSVNLIMLIVTSGISVAMAFMGYGVWSLLLGGIAGSCVKSVLLTNAARWRPSFSFDFSRARSLMRYGALSSLGNFLVHLNGQSSLFIVSRMLDAHALGLFNKANQFSQIPHTLVTGPVYQVTFRALASTANNKDLNQYLYLRAITLVTFYATPPFVAMVWLGKPIITLLYGAKWIDCAGLLLFFAAVGPLLAIESLSGCVLAARNWLGREIPVQVSMLLIVILGTIAGAPYGLNGMCLGVCLASVYGCVHMSWLAGRCLGLPMRRILLAPLAPLGYGAAMAMLWAGLDHQFRWHESLPQALYVALYLALGGALYVSLFFFLPTPPLATERTRWMNLFKERGPTFLRATKHEPS